MLLSIKPLKKFNNINSFEYATEWNTRAGDPNRIYFQLYDMEEDLRYIPTDSSYSVAVTFPSVIPGQAVTKTASQASPLDRSIWYVDILASDKIYSGSIRVELIEGGVSKKFSVLDAMIVEPINQGGC